jgi:uncharacterized protein
MSNQDFSALTSAIEHEDFVEVKKIVEDGIDVNQKDFYGATPLHLAVDSSIDGTIQTGGSPGDEPTEIILYLLKHGANLTAKDSFGKTPIDWAEQSAKITNLLKDWK